MYTYVVAYEAYVSEHLWEMLCGSLFLYLSKHARPDSSNKGASDKVLNCAIELFIVSKKSAEGRCEERT